MGAICTKKSSAAIADEPVCIRENSVACSTVESEPAAPPPPPPPAVASEAQQKEGAAATTAVDTSTAAGAQEQAEVAAVEAHGKRDSSEAQSKGEEVDSEPAAEASAAAAVDASAAAAESQPEAQAVDVAADDAGAEEPAASPSQPAGSTLPQGPCQGPGKAAPGGGAKPRHPSNTSSILSSSNVAAGLTSPPSTAPPRDASPLGPGPRKKTKPEQQASQQGGQPPRHLQPVKPNPYGGGYGNKPTPALRRPTLEAGVARKLAPGIASARSAYGQAPSVRRKNASGRGGKATSDAAAYAASVVMRNYPRYPTPPASAASAYSTSVCDDSASCCLDSGDFEESERYKDSLDLSELCSSLPPSNFATRRNSRVFDSKEEESLQEVVGAVVSAAAQSLSSQQVVNSSRQSSSSGGSSSFETAAPAGPTHRGLPQPRYGSSQLAPMSGMHQHLYPGCSQRLPPSRAAISTRLSPATSLSGASGPKPAVEGGRNQLDIGPAASRTLSSLAEEFEGDEPPTPSEALASSCPPEEAGISVQQAGPSFRESLDLSLQGSDRLADGRRSSGMRLVLTPLPGNSYSQEILGISDLSIMPQDSPGKVPSSHQANAGSPCAKPLAIVA